VKRLLIVLLLAGCAQQERPAEPVIKTTVYRYTSQACEKPEKAPASLKRMTADRDEWKRYAEKLEKLLPKNPAP
jgi:hypothetical protein